MAETSPQPIAGASTFDIGGVLGRGFSVTFGNIVPFGLLALIVTSPSFLYGILVVSGGMGASALSQFLTSILQLLLNSVATAALIYGTIQVLRNQPVALNTCLSRGFALVFPVIGLIILVSLIIGIGFVLLFVPGLILATMLWVAIPVAVIERPGVVASMKRSAELTKGNRWRIFGLLVIVLVIQIVIGVVLVSIFGVGAMAGGGVAGGSIVFVLFQWLIQAFFAVLYAVIIAVSYQNLRIAKEGGSLDQIASVFD